MTRPDFGTGCRVAALALLALAWLVVPSPAVAQAPPVPAGAQVTPPPLPPPQLAGRWELNVQASDPPPSRNDQPAEDEGSRGSGGGGRGGRSGGGHRGTGGEEGGSSKSKAPESSAVRQEMDRAVEAPRFLIIVQHEASLSVTDDEGRVTSLKPDGTKVTEEQGGGSVERTTRWDGRALVTTIRLSNGAKITHTFTKVFDGLQLVIITRIEGGRFQNPIEFKRVYDQAFQ
jgi:hypothetical protein